MANKLTAIECRNARKALELKGFYVASRYTSEGVLFWGVYGLGDQHLASVPRVEYLDDLSLPTAFGVALEVAGIQ